MVTQVQGTERDTAVPALEDQCERQALDGFQLTVEYRTTDPCQGSGQGLTGTYSKDGPARLRGQERSRKTETRENHPSTCMSFPWRIILNCSNCFYRPDGGNGKTCPLWALAIWLLLARTPHSHPQKLVSALAHCGGASEAGRARRVKGTIPVPHRGGRVPVTLCG